MRQPDRIDVRLVCDDGQVIVEDRRRPDPDDEATPARTRAMGAPQGVADHLSPAVLAGLVRELTAVRLVEETARGRPARGHADPRRPGRRARSGAPSTRPAPGSKRAVPDFLRVPFGLGPAGEKVYLDIKENALGGMGPHGLCVGATGSGKSEVLRTIVLCLAITHPPERLAMVLVDYKGGATFAGLEDLPHCAAMISNLSDDDGLVDRLHDALFGEMKRRQQRAGRGREPAQHHRVQPPPRRCARRGPENGYRAAGPLPNLFVVIDEFGELLTAKPDFIELFLAIGRIGRSIGVHLLLASQRLEEGRLRGLESFLSYRLGLRTFNAQESRSVLGVPDAYELPPIPGSGYLKVDTSVFQRFKAGYVSGTYRPPVTGETVIDTEPVVAPFPLFNDTAAYLAAIADRPAADDRPDADEDALAPTVLDVAVRRLADGRHPDRADLAAAAAGGARPGRGRRAGAGRPGRAAWSPTARAAGCKVPVGLLDKPAEQKQVPFVLDLAASGGHLVVLGAPQSGKSVMLRTVIVSAGAEPPARRDLLLLPGSGRRVAAGARRPAARRRGGAPAGRRPGTPHGRRGGLGAGRARGAVRPARHRLGRGDARAVPGRPAARARGRRHLPGDRQLPGAAGGFRGPGRLVQDLGTRGPGYGIHLILATGRWADIRMQLQAAIGTKIELRLNDPVDSTIARKAAANLRADTPGRAIVEPGLQVHICLPMVADLAAAPGAGGRPAGAQPAGATGGLDLSATRSRGRHGRRRAARSGGAAPTGAGSGRRTVPRSWSRGSPRPGTARRCRRSGCCRRWCRTRTLRPPPDRGRGVVIGVDETRTAAGRARPVRRRAAPAGLRRRRDRQDLVAAADRRPT